MIHSGDINLIRTGFPFCHGHYSSSSLSRLVSSSHLVCSIWLMFQTQIRAVLCCNILQ